jgi:hypothetical protein
LYAKTNIFSRARLASKGFELLVGSDDHCSDPELIAISKTFHLKIISGVTATSAIIPASGKRRGLLLSRNITSGCRGFGRPNFLMKLAFHQDFCYHFACEKKWLRDEDRFRAFPLAISPN